MDLLALADFNLVARYEGFGRAARATGRPKATLSRRVTELEASLGLRLFERGSRTLRLTEEGRALSARTGALLTELEETAAEISSGGQRPRGQLRISAPLLFSQVAMGKLAGGFARRHPEVRLEITTEDRAVDMVEEAYDLVIRVNPKPDESLVGRVFLRDRLVIVASPDFKLPTDGSPIPSVARIGASDDETWEMKKAGETSIMTVRPSMTHSSLVTMRDAVRTGVGIGRLPISLVSHDLAAGTLVHWGDVEGPEIPLWVLYPTRRLLSARVSAFLDYLRDVFPTGTPAEFARFVEG